MMLGDCARGVAWRSRQQQNRDTDIESILRRPPPQLSADMERLQAPRKYKLVIIRTAKALGIAVPPRR
jgi:hypothetical protein